MVPGRLGRRPPAGLDLVPAGFAAGGSVSLAELIDEHGGAIEADLQRFYGADLLDVYRGRLHPRKVLRWLAWLPDDGAFAASVRGGRPWLGWGQDRTIAVDSWDLAVTAAMAGSKKKPPTYPRPSARQVRQRPRAAQEV
jgi:hypothetical protein